MTRKLRQKHKCVHCRIGSLENAEVCVFWTCCVHCRIGSLENSWSDALAMVTSSGSCLRFTVERLRFTVDRPRLLRPSNTSRAGPISPLDIPFKYSHGTAASRLIVFLTYGGTRADRKVTASPVFDRTLGIVTVTGPNPVCSSRSGR